MNDIDLKRALKQAGGNREEAAKILGVSLRTVYRNLKKENKEEKTESDSKYERALSKTQGNKKQAAKLLGISPSKLQRDLENLEIQGFYKKVKKSKVYVLTTAQNATPVNDSFFASLLQYCDFNSAELVVIPSRYKNPTSMWSHNGEQSDWWDEKLVPYLCDSRFNINSNLTVLADIKTQPTAVNPLSGFESISREKSAIFGHTKLMLSTVPVVTGNYPKIIATTGAVTERNYTETKAGKKGDFHHAFAALVVEVKDDEIFHLRQINAVSDGSFIDLNYEYTPSSVYHAAPAAGLVMGDWHGLHVDPNVVKGTFTNKNSIVNLLQPLNLVWHDALDFYSRNHWHAKNPFINLAKHKAGVDDVEQEVRTTFEQIEKLANGIPSIFPFSNHPDALARWIKDADWKYDPRNAEFYLETALQMVRSTRMVGHKSETVDPFEYWGNKILQNPENFKFLSPNDTHDIKGIKVDMHGHLGPNGSRGGPAKTFAKLGVKTITGHSHGPAIYEGAYRVGTSSVYDPEYVAGPSNWLHTHCAVYANGKRSLINLIHDEYKI